MVDEAKAHSDGIYRAGKRCKPEDLQTHLAEAQDVLRALVRG
jgi:methylphosphotriester-DNA--protein-cysteine methyltransferase